MTTVAEPGRVGRGAPDLPAEPDIARGGPDVPAGRGLLRRVLDERDPVRRVLRDSWRGRGGELRALAAWSALEAVPAFLSGILVAQAIDSGFLARRTSVGFAWLGVFAVAVLAGAVGTRRAYHRLAMLVEPLRDALVERVVADALRRSTAAGGLADVAAVARVTQQVEIAREAYAGVLMVAQQFAIATTGALLGLLTLAPLLLPLVLAPLTLSVWQFWRAISRMAERQRDSILAEERIAAGTGALAAGLRDVAACGAEEDAAAMLAAPIEAQARATRELARLSAARSLALALGGWLPVLAILLAAPWLVRQGVSTGALVGALTYVAQGIHPAVETLVRGLGHTGLWLVVTLRRIVEEDGPPDAAQDRAAPATSLGSAPEVVPRSSGSTPEVVPRSSASTPDVVPRSSGSTPEAIRTGPARLCWRPALYLDGLTFAYSPSSEPVIRGLNLRVPDGEHLAIVGPSGAGKSTLAALIAGILQPQAGSVRLGATPLSDMETDALAQERVLIPQEAYVFRATLRENLVYLAPGADDAALDRVVDELEARALVTRIGGYSAELSPEALSAGERQLLTLVRAYLAPARLAILDEASCHLDQSAEACVERAFARRPGSLIVVAHRISSARRAKRILVLDGACADLGTHRELLVRSALYRDLFGYWEAGEGGDATTPRPWS